MRTEQLLPAFEVRERFVATVELGQRPADVVVRVRLVCPVAILQRGESLLRELKRALPLTVVERRGRLVLERTRLRDGESRLKEPVAAGSPSLALPVR